MEYTLTKKDVAKLLERTPKSVGRYIKLKQLHPTLVKRGRYQKYMFNIEEVKRLKVGLQEGTLGGKQEGTLEGTSVNTPTHDKQPSTNNLHGVQEGTQEGKQERTQEGTKGDDVELVKTLNRVIDILGKQVDNTSKVVENQSRQIDEIMVQQRFLLNENTAFRKQLGLPTVKDDINNGSYSEVLKEVVEVVKEQEGKQGEKQEGKVGGTNKQPKQPNQPPKKSKGKGKSKSRGKGSKGVNKDGNKVGNKGVQEQVKQPQNNPITSGKTGGTKEVKKDDKERFNIFRWIFK